MVDVANVLMDDLTPSEILECILDKSLSITPAYKKSFETADIWEGGPQKPVDRLEDSGTKEWLQYMEGTPVRNVKHKLRKKVSQILGPLMNRCFSITFPRIMQVWERVEVEMDDYSVSEMRVVSKKRWLTVEKLVPEKDIGLWAKLSLGWWDVLKAKPGPKPVFEITKVPDNRPALAKRTFA